jgi:hypothetical protein
VEILLAPLGNRLAFLHQQFLINSILISYSSVSILVLADCDLCVVYVRALVGVRGW